MFCKKLTMLEIQSHRRIWKWVRGHVVLPRQKSSGGHFLTQIKWKKQNKSLLIFQKRLFLNTLRGFLLGGRGRLQRYVVAWGLTRLGHKAPRIHVVFFLCLRCSHTCLYDYHRYRPYMKKEQQQRVVHVDNLGPPRVNHATTIVVILIMTREAIGVL